VKLTVIVTGFVKHGLHFLSLFVPKAPWYLLILLVPIEVISFLTRPISLSVRLFAIMLAGHTMLYVFGTFVIGLATAGGVQTGATIKLTNAGALQNIGVDVVTLDSAHGHHIGVINALKSLKKTFKNLQVIAGNIGTATGAKALADAGADAVKVGIGPGSICTTRIVAGVLAPRASQRVHRRVANRNRWRGPRACHGGAQPGRMGGHAR